MSTEKILFLTEIMDNVSEEDISPEIRDDPVETVIYE